MQAGNKKQRPERKEKKKDSEYIGVFREDEMAIAFYLRGQIGWNKIPELIKSFQADDMLNVLDFKTENFGNNPHN